MRELEVTHETLVAERDIPSLNNLFAEFRQQDIWKWLKKVDALTTKYIVRKEEIAHNTASDTEKWISGTKTKEERKVKGQATQAQEDEKTLHNESEITAAYDKLNPRGVLHKTRSILTLSEFVGLLNDVSADSLSKDFEELIKIVHIDLVNYPQSGKPGFQLVRLEFEYKDDVSEDSANRMSTRKLFEHFLECLSENDIDVAESAEGQKKLAIEARKKDGIIKTPQQFFKNTKNTEKIVPTAKAA